MRKWVVGFVLLLLQRINADGVIYDDVPTQDLVSQRSELPSLAINLLAVLVLGGEDRPSSHDLPWACTQIARRCSPSELHKHRRARGMDGSRFHDSHYSY